MLSRNKYKFLLLAVPFFFVFNIVFSGSVYADIPENDIIAQKVFYTGVKNCYESDWLKSTVLFTDFLNGTLDNLSNDANAQLRKQPYIGRYYGDNNSNNSSISCYSLITEKTAVKYPTLPNQATSERENRLPIANYQFDREVEVSNGSDYFCASFPIIRYVRSVDTEYGKMLNYTNKICVMGGSGSFNLRKEVVGSDDTFGPIDFSIDNANKKVTVIINTCKVKPSYSGWSKSGTKCQKTLPLSNIQHKENVLHFIGTTVIEGMGSDYNNHNYDTYTTQVCSDYLRKEGCTSGSSTEYHNNTGNMVFYYYWSACDSFTTDMQEGSASKLLCSSSDSQFPSEQLTQTLQSTTRVRQFKKNENLAVRHFSNDHFTTGDAGNNEYSIKFDQIEIYRLYDYYLTNVYHASDPVCFDGPRTGHGSGPVKLWSEADGGYNPYCYINVDHESDKVYGVYSVNRLFGRTLDFNLIVNQLNNLNITERPDSVTIDPETGEQVDDTDVQPQGASPSCMNSGMAGSMAWILCPIGESMGDAISGIYSSFLEPMLMVDSENLFKLNDPNNGTYGA